MSSGTSLEAGGASTGYNPRMYFSLGLELRLKLEFNSERKCEFFLGAVSETETGNSVRKSLSSNKFRKVWVANPVSLLTKVAGGPGKGVLDLEVGLQGLKAEVAELNQGCVWRVEGVEWRLEVANRDELASSLRSTGLTTLERLLGWGIEVSTKVGRFWPVETTAASPSTWVVSLRNWSSSLIRRSSSR